MEEEESKPVMVEIKDDIFLIISQIACHGGIAYPMEEEMEL